MRRPVPEQVRQLRQGGGLLVHVRVGGRLIALNHRLHTDHRQLEQVAGAHLDDRVEPLAVGVLQRPERNKPTVNCHGADALVRKIAEGPFADAAWRRDDVLSHPTHALSCVGNEFAGVVNALQLDAAAARLTVPMAPGESAASRVAYVSSHEAGRGEFAVSFRTPALDDYVV